MTLRTECHHRPEDPRGSVAGAGRLLRVALPTPTASPRPCGRDARTYNQVPIPGMRVRLRGPARARVRAPCRCPCSVPVPVSVFRARVRARAPCRCPCSVPVLRVGVRRPCRCPRLAPFPPASSASSARGFFPTPAQRGVSQRTQRALGGKIPVPPGGTNPFPADPCPVVGAGVSPARVGGASPCGEHGHTQHRALPPQGHAHGGIQP